MLLHTQRRIYEASVARMREKAIKEYRERKLAGARRRMNEERERLAEEEEEAERRRELDAHAVNSSGQTPVYSAVKLPCDSIMHGVCLISTKLFADFFVSGFSPRRVSCCRNACARSSKRKTASNSRR